jgi:hypothetical protein
VIPLILFTIWLVVALFLCFVFLPYLSAKQIIPKYEVENWGIVFLTWPLSFITFIVACAAILIFGGMAFVITASIKNVFSWMEKKFQGHVKEDPK